MLLRILTYNVHKCIGGLDRRYEPERVIGTIAHYDPDIVLLQEVDEEAERSRFHRQVDLLGDGLRFAHRVFYPNVKLRRGGRYGNAVLSRFPIDRSQNIDLSIPLKKPRGVLHARCRVPFKGTERTVHVYNMHLGLAGFERGMQLRRFLGSHPFATLHHRTPIVVGGDLNDVWGTLGERFLEPAGFRRTGGPIKTFPAFRPVRALDAIFVRGEVEPGRCFQARVETARQASDHLPLIAELWLGE
jgi:endonuclease/exonuclease/phosphatase family metal-dependent hydrolase